MSSGAKLALYTAEQEDQILYTSMPGTSSHHALSSQVRDDCQNGVQHGCAEADGALWGPVLNGLASVVGVFEGHLQREGEAVVALPHCAGADRQVGLPWRIHPIAIPVSP